jgi:hypothetical protein
MILVTSCGIGFREFKRSGFYSINDNEINKLHPGNAMGMCRVNETPKKRYNHDGEAIYFMCDGLLHKYADGRVVAIREFGKYRGVHDIKWGFGLNKDHFLVAGGYMHYIAQVDFDGRVFKMMESPGWHVNCLTETPDGDFIVSTDALFKMNLNGEVLWKMNLKGDLFHSFGWKDNRLYWCNTSCNEVQSAKYNRGKLIDLRTEVKTDRGFLRGLDFYGDTLVVGLSKLRTQKPKTRTLWDRQWLSRANDVESAYLYFYQDGEKVNEKMLPFLEIYDILVLESGQKICKFV